MKFKQLPVKLVIFTGNCIPKQLDKKFKVSLPSTVPDTQETGPGTTQIQDLPRLQNEYEATLGSSVKSCLRIKCKERAGNSSVNACLAYLRSQFRSPINFSQLLQNSKSSKFSFLWVLETLRKGNRLISSTIPCGMIHSVLTL